MIKFTKCEKKPPVKYPLHPKFGSIFAPHSLRINFNQENIDKDQLTAEIIPFEKELFSPGNITLHYGQSIFEGLKVFKQKDGSVAAFRADLHAERFMKSCRRMAMPVLGEKVFLDCLKEYMHFVADNVPGEEDHSLYIRPIQFGRDEIVKVGRSQSYSFYILSTIAGSYFHNGQIKPAKVYVGRQFVRAFPGGLGEIKTAANYAASLQPQTYAAEKFQCDQVLYLNGIDHDSIDELGGMNFFIVRNGELVTPSLNGTILGGITRRTILELAPSLGFRASERKISFTEMLKEIKSGHVTETFACGTAAVISPIGEFVFQENIDKPAENIKMPTATPIAQKLRTAVQAVQRGEVQAPGDWHFR